MGEVSSAVDAIKAQIATLHDLCEDLSHRELIGLLSELTSVVWSVPALEHQVLARLTGETEPSAVGAASWVNVLTTALRISSDTYCPKTTTVNDIRCEASEFSR